MYLKIRGSIYKENLLYSLFLQCDSNSDKGILLSLLFINNQLIFLVSGAVISASVLCSF